LAEKHQLPGLLGHQLIPTGFLSYSYVKNVYQVKNDNLQQFKACTRDTGSTASHNMLKNMWTEVQYHLDICCAARGACTEIYLGRQQSEKKNSRVSLYIGVVWMSV
jgi:hypothetical protein